MISKFFKFVVGVLFGAICAFVLSPGLAAIHSDQSSLAPILTFAVVILVTVLATFAPTIRRALGRGFLILGACFVFLPISALMLSGRAANEVISGAEQANQAAAAVGAGLAGVAVTGAATFFGLILGAICLIIGLVLALGGRREVIIIERPTT